MKVQIRRLNSEFLMEAHNEAGNTIQMDNSTAENQQGFSPMQLLLAGIGGCSMIDILMILKKQRQDVQDIHIHVEGQRVEQIPKVFEKIILHYIFFGSVEPEKAQRAIELSLEKYCSVSKMLEKTAQISYTFEVKNSNNLQS
ncbi:MAG: OsmC family protein [Microscillaceae bacterium]|nr:OsmC family protein [Microscillaceae bacterium]MDW8461585.1 OsmC family protein [Cytophagales bacterium]